MQYQPSQRFAIGASAPAQTLLGHVLGITAIGLCITAAASYFFASLLVGHQWIAFIAMLIGFGLLFAIHASRANETLALLLFYAFAFLEGIGIAPAIGFYLSAIGPAEVFQAALTTGLGMLALACVVYATGLDLRRFQGYFVMALLGLILLGVVSIFVRWIHPAVYSWLTLLIFAGLTLIDFARIRAGGDGLTPVQIAVQIYLDAINIFLAILQLMALRRSED